MHRFEVFSDGQHIGWSDFELGDPPMGVVHGVFVPSSGYSGIQDHVRAFTHRDQRHFKFTVRIVNGEEIRASGVSVTDYSDDLEAGEIEVAVLGIEYPAYEELFPELVEAYRRQF